MVVKRGGVVGGFVELVNVHGGGDFWLNFESTPQTEVADGEATCGARVDDLRGGGDKLPRHFHGAGNVERGDIRLVTVNKV